MKKIKENECLSFNSKYHSGFDRYYREITDMQLNDPVLWSLLVRQFVLKTDNCDEGWRGEYWGKLMRGSCMVYAYTRDNDLYKTLEQATLLLLATQEDTGRISSYSKVDEFKGWDVWGRKYVMLGLEHFYEICEDESLKARVLDALQKHADNIMERMGDGEGKVPVCETSRMHGALNSVSIIQPYVRLYKYTRKEKYLRYAETLANSQWKENGVFDLAIKDRLAPFEYPYTKAYEMTSCFEGLLELHEVSPDERYLRACVLFANKVLATDLTVVGGSGCYDEYFNNSAKMQVVPSDIHKQETCVTVTLMKFLTALYKQTNDVAYLDAIENSFFNAYLGAFINQPNNAYLPVPMFYSYSPIYNNPRWTLMGGCKNISQYAKCGCCVAIGAAGLDPFPQVGAVLKDGTVYVNFFVAGKYETVINGKKISFVIESDYPYDGNVKIRFEKVEISGLRLSVRKPVWCDGYTVKKHGETLTSEACGYIDLGEISAFDQADISFNADVRVRSSKIYNPEAEELFCVTKGPIVLCAEEGDTDLDASYLLRAGEKLTPVLIENGGTEYEFLLDDGKTLRLKAYHSAGKNYYEPYRISVWLKGKKEGEN